MRYLRTSILTHSAETIFKPGLGYHVPSSASAVLYSRLGQDCDDAFELNSYVTSLHTSEDVVAHSALEISKRDMCRMDHFFISVELMTDIAAYSKVVGGPYCSTFLRQPFQQLMRLHTIVSMIRRCDLIEYNEFILLHVKKALGMPWMTQDGVDKLMRCVDHKVMGYNIRRRMGKSVGMFAEISASLVFFPQAHLRALYTVNNAHMTIECFNKISDVLPAYVELFNELQNKRYIERTTIRGEIDSDDFYYVATYETYTTDKRITVEFHKHDNNGLMRNKIGTMNTLYCRTYCLKVSVIAQHKAFSGTY